MHPAPGPRVRRAVSTVAATLLVAGLAACSTSDDAADAAGGDPTAAASSVPDAADSNPAPDPSSEPSGTLVQPSEDPSAAATSAPAGTVEAPSGVVPDGWQPVGPAGGPVFALPAGYQTQDVGRVAEGVTVVLHAAADGSVVVQDQRFAGEQYAAAVPDELLRGGVEGGIAGGGLTAEDRRDFQVQGRPASEFRAPDPTGTGAYIAARFVVDDGVLLGFIATQPDEDSAVAALDQAWDTLRLP